MSVMTAPQLLSLALDLAWSSPLSARWYALQASTLATDSVTRTAARALWSVL